MVYYPVLTIGSLELPSHYVLSPMAGVSDLSFRMICREFGSFLAYTEMVSARALMFGNRKTFQFLTTNAADAPLGIQFLAGDEEVLRSAVKALEGAIFDILELNAACPVTKVVRRGEGAGLLKEPPRLYRLLKTLVDVSPVPVTVKIRTGWDDQSINAVEVARLAEDAGVKGIFIHGRTRQQGYGGSISYQAIRDVKQAVTIPVIASGNIFSTRLAARMFLETGCDGVAVARGALGHPWIFRDLLRSQYGLHDEQGSEIDEVARVMRKHLNSSIEEHGERIGVINFRKFFVWYSRGFSNVAPLGKGALSARTPEEMHLMIDRLMRERRS
jgi:nifR3 family TIM-barrel protein